MEAVAIATAQSALNSVVKTARTTITNEIGLLLGVQEELFFIKEELQMMRAFLCAAKIENMKGEIVTTWIRQVEELAFDVEDCLQEASVHLMKKNCLPVMCSMKKRNHIAKTIRVLKTRIEDVSKRNLRYNLINKENGSHTYDESVSTRLIANVEALLVGLDEPKRKLVELILKEEEDVISVVGMGGLGKTTLVKEVSGCQELRDKFKCFVWITVLHPFNMEEFIKSLAKQILFNAQEIDNKGRTVEENKIKKTVKENVTEYLKENKYLIVLDDLCSLSEWDKINDVLPPVNGRRIIVTTRYRSPLAESITHSCDNIYEVKELSEKDAIDLFCKAVYKSSKYRPMNGEGPSSTQIKKVDSKVQKQCITNTITKEEDREIKDDPPHQSKCNMKEDPSNTEIMEENSEEQKQRIANTITKDMETQASLIIKSCGRLPLAIVTIGSYLATKPKTSVEWKKMHNHLSSELANNPKLGKVQTVLTSSYDNLPHHLKPSLLYLSVFHNHKEIRRSRIIRRWMADGYVMEDRKKKAEEVGKDYFYDLMGRNLIQPSQMSTIVNGDINRCNIHDLMYELILGKAVDENMVSVLEDENLITMTDKVRHLVIAGGSSTGDKLQERLKVSHMRSVSIFGDVGDYFRHTRMKLLRVLDLESTLNLNKWDLRSLGKLRHLKYLGLRGTKITELPDSLGKLRELETLDIRNTAVVRLPTGLTKLQKLSYIRAGFDSYTNPDIILVTKAFQTIQKCSQHFPTFYHPTPLAILVSMLTCLLCCACCCIPPCILKIIELTGMLGIDYSGLVGVRAPSGIGKLRSLNVLGTIDIGQNKGLIKEMQNLTNLRKLAVTGITKENGKILAMVIDGLKHLMSLNLSEADGTSGLRSCLESVSSPPRYLQSLKLYSPLQKLPDWISSLENMEKIYLRFTTLKEDIGSIGKLSNLKILNMSYASIMHMKKLCFGERTLPKLQVMILEGIPDLESVEIKQTALKRLERLKISNCQSIRVDGVSGLDFLEQLKEMEVVVYERESDKMFVSNLQEKLSMHPNKPGLRVFKTANVLV